MYTISEFAKLINVTGQTLRNWHSTGKLIPIILESGHRRYTEDHLNQVLKIKPKDKLNIIYCRELTTNQKSSLDAQLVVCKKYCEVNGVKIDKAIVEFGSGMNFKRNGLNELMSLIISGSVSKVIISHKDRLARFGIPLIEHICKEMRTELIIIDNTDFHKSKQEEFAEDIIAIIHHFSMKLYGSRSYKKELVSENL
jgi:predicted site-specific integrase-resolvase